jgi:hypothetical protein
LRYNVLKIFQIDAEFEEKVLLSMMEEVRSLVNNSVFKGSAF